MEPERRSRPAPSPPKNPALTPLQQKAQELYGVDLSRQPDLDAVQVAVRDMLLAGYRPPEIATGLAKVTGEIEVRAIREIRSLVRQVLHAYGDIPLRRLFFHFRIRGGTDDDMRSIFSRWEKPSRPTRTKQG
jgi:hypothetical protein